MIRLAMTIAILLLGSMATFADEWGSIAYSPRTGAWGYSHNYDTRNIAGQWAMSYCDDNASDCRVVVNFKNACGALAIGRNGWGADWGPTRASAENNAVAACQAYTGGCRVKQWVCSK